MTHYYTQEDLDEALSIVQEYIDNGDWLVTPGRARWIFEWYVFLTKHGADKRKFDAPLEFWLGEGDLQLDDNFASNDQYGGAPIQGLESEDDEPGPSHYPTLQGTQQPEPMDWEYTEPARRKTVYPAGYEGILPDSDDSLEWEDDSDSNDSDNGFDPEHFYEIKQAAEPIYSRMFKTERKHFTVSFRNTDQFSHAEAKMVMIFDSILGKLLAGYSLDDSTGMQIRHPALDTPIYIPLTRHSYLNGHKILKEIQRVQQSKTELRLDDNLEFIMVSVQPPRGTGWSERSIHFNTWFDKSRSKIKIKNGDYLCMARAIVTAIAHRQNDPRYQTIRNGDLGRKTSLQKRRAMELMRDAGLANHNGSCGIKEAAAMQAVIKKECKLKIFAHNQQSWIFSGISDAAAEIYLFLKDNHYDVITLLPGFFNSSYYCTECGTRYNQLSDHKCKNTCSGCFRSPAHRLPPNGNYIMCNDCNRYFMSQECFDIHKKTQTGYKTNGKKKRKTETSICDRYKCCVECGQFIRDADKKDHVCNSFECPTCRKTIIKGEHKCYIQPIGNNTDNEEEEEDEDEDDEEADNAGKDLQEAKEAAIIKYVFFDFETSQGVQIGENEQGAIYKHTVNLCIAHTVCEDCRNVETAGCRRCGPREKIFCGENCLENFCEWLFAAGPKKQQVIAMAHNSEGFDGQFILNYLEKQGILKPKIIDKGLELMSIEVGHVKIMDSLNFLPMALKTLPKAFGVDELSKGYFPHLFNLPENWNYIGAWPAAHYYSPKTMKQPERQAFEKWYAQQTDKVFNFEEEIIKYCRSDVDILRRAILKFRDIFFGVTGVEPFDSSLTIASACNRVYRSLFLKPDTIGIIPHGGYRTKQKQSNIALKWLKWIAKTRNIRIQHARNGGEFRVEPYNFLADGRYGNEIFEFNGCYWHGCPDCMKEPRQRTVEQQLTAKEAYTRTVKRRRDIEALGFTVTEIWGCELDRQLKADPEMKQFFDSVKILPPMDPRDAFFGGRTNAVQLYACIERDEEGRPLEHISYLDVCSLYPWVNKYGRFPTGHPEIITENFADMAYQPYEGVIKCKVVPPRRLLHPLLPYRSKKDGKLTFPLCLTCVETMENGECMHNDEERSITGTWATLEIYKAMELGYKVIEIYEVYHYDMVAQYDPETKSGGLFMEYINMFVRLKQQADGWPSWVQTEEDKDRYIAEYEAKEGIRLEKDAIAKNPGLRSLAKLMLNSFWGKFGQRNNKRKTEHFTEPGPYFACIEEVGRIIHSIRIVNEHMVCVVSSMEDDFVEVLGNTNAIIAAYTTAQARLKLYSYIEKLGDRLIYFDTDSVIFKNHLADPYEYRVPTGSYLGDMTNELKDYGAGAFIEEFVSTGPKSYGMKIFSPKDNSYQYIVKAKGFSLTSEASKIINFDNLKELVYKFVKENVTEKLSVNFDQIARLPDHSVVTKPLRKDYRVVYTKRVVKPDYTTLPYGY